jgi:hypothetical protein
VTRLAPAGIAIVACALAAAPPASSAISIGRGIAGVRLGMRQALVRARLGTPLRVDVGKNEFGTYTELRYRGYVVDFQNGSTVTSIATTLARERTASGIGVGSLWSQVRARVERVRCEGTSILGDCHVGDFLPGRAVTDFVVSKSRVVRVVVGYVLG